MDISRSNRNVAPAGENRSVAIPNCLQNNHQKSKYQRWYEELCSKARCRIIPACYTEVHHVLPRSLGGSDDGSNLVRLTYREHFICHWLLTKIHTGINLHKMQRALWAMTLKASGERLTAGWQIDAAKRAVRDMELNDAVDEAARERWSQKRQAEIDLCEAACRELGRKSRIKDLEEAVYKFPDMLPPEEVAAFKLELKQRIAENSVIPSSGRVIFKNGFYQTTRNEKDMRMYPKWHPPTPKFYLRRIAVISG